MSALEQVCTLIRQGLCASCGACVALSDTRESRMSPSPDGPVPCFAPGDELSALAWEACPGKGVDYPALYRAHYGRLPDNWLTGIVERVRTGHAADPSVRLAGASGGVITRTLQHLLESGRIDAAIVARQGEPTATEANPVYARSAETILQAAGSVYIPVPMLAALRDARDGERYAMTCTPEQAVALRWMQKAGDKRARQVHYVLGPYTGTALTPAALDYYVRSNGIPKSDPLVSVKWRAGDWPGYLELATRSGRILRSPKVYYNFLIPFFVTRTSLLSMDFCNEFADLAVGDAWSPAFEAKREGMSVVVTRTPAMEAVVAEMSAAGLLAMEDADPLAASDMHGHMLDFKKRGGYLRGRFRHALGLAAPDYGYRPERVAPSRCAVELVISSIFLVARTRFARWCVCQLPERWLGPAFNRLRLGWKALSRPTKRKGLADYKVVVGNPDSPPPP